MIHRNKIPTIQKTCMILLFNSWLCIFLINTEEVTTLRASCPICLWPGNLYKWQFSINQNIGLLKRPNSSIIFNHLEFKCVSLFGEKTFSLSLSLSYTHPSRMAQLLWSGRERNDHGSQESSIRSGVKSFCKVGGARGTGRSSTWGTLVRRDRMECLGL